jgi:hypothetical protein
MVERCAFRGHAGVRIVLQHLSGEVPRYGHERLLATDRAVRVVQTIRQQPVKRLRVQRDEQGERRAVKETALEPSTNFYGARFDPSGVSPSIRPQSLDY